MCLQASDVLFDDQVVCKSISDTLVVALKWVLGKTCKNSTVKSSLPEGNDGTWSQLHSFSGMLCA